MNVVYAFFAIAFVIAAGLQIIKACFQTVSYRRQGDWEMLLAYAVISFGLGISYKIFPGFGQTLAVAVFVTVTAYLIFGYIVDREDRHAARDNAIAG